MVQGRGDLPGPREILLRRQQRWHRRLRRADREARLHRRPRREHSLAAAVLPVATPRRRLRHRPVPWRAQRLWQPRRRPPVHRRGPSTRSAGDYRAGDQPHLRPASLVHPRPPREEGVARPRLLRLVGQRREIPGYADHLHRHRAVQLDLGPGSPTVLLAPLLFPPAGPELRQPAGPARGARGDALLAGHGRRRPAPGRDSLPDRTRRHQQREPAGDPPGAQAHPRRAGRALSRPHAAGRGQPVAGRHPAVLRRRGWRRGRRMPHGLPLPADAAHVHGHRPGGSLSDHRHPAPDPGHPGQLPMGDLPAQPRRADPGDGHRRRARLSLEPLCRRPPRAPQPGHPPAPGAAGGA